MAKERVIFFDGVCGLCNGFVDFVLPRDKNKALLFSPLQSEKAAEYLSPELVEDLTTIVFYDAGKIYVRSEAVLRALAYLGSFWKILPGFLVLPAFIRDSLYRFIATNRYRWFGEKETCRLPTADERERFLT